MLARQGQPDLREQRAIQAQPAQQGQPVRRAMLVQLDRLAQLVLPVIPDQPALPE